ncbi:MAG: tetratricopeptide repeat protein [Terriglobia bacterium]
MTMHVRRIGAAFSLFLFLGGSLWAAQQPAPAEPGKAPAQVLNASPTTPDHAKAYYHFMLARRYKELAGVYNRSDYLERAVSEYKQAIAADPDSLFLRVELAELYWRAGRVGDAIREAEAVLKADPDYPDAHRLLARIYFHMLDTTQPDRNATKQSLGKAIEHLEVLVGLTPNDTDSWLLLGRLYRASNQPAKAEEALRKVLKTDPESKVGLANLAELYFQQGDYSHAAEALTKIPESDMDSQLLGTLAYAYSQTRDFDKAVATYEKALAQDPDNTELRRAYADALFSNGKNAAARVELQKILKSDPDDDASYMRLAQIDRQEGRFDDARQELDKAKALKPDNPEIPFEQALLEETVGNDEKALQILQGLVKQSERREGQYTPAEANNRALFLERLGLVCRGQEKFAQALGAFKQILALGKSQGPRAEFLIVETLRMDRQPDKALAEAEAAIQTYPQDRPLKILHATLLGERGHVDEAVEQLQALLTKGRTDREIYISIAQVYSQAKRYGDAESAVRKSLDMTPNTDDQEYALYILGSIYERQKRYDLAEETFKKVLSVNPLNSSAANYLGYMLADRGVRLEESVNYIKKAVELEPNNGAYLDSLGWAYFKMNRYALAVPHLEKAARLIQNDPTIHEHLGNLYLRMGKPAMAQEEWERALKEWPQAVSSDFDAEQAAKLQKQLDELKVHLASEKSAQK